MRGLQMFMHARGGTHGRGVEYEWNVLDVEAVGEAKEGEHKAGDNHLKDAMWACSFLHFNLWFRCMCVFQQIRIQMRMEMRVCA